MKSSVNISVKEDMKSEGGTRDAQGIAVRGLTNCARCGGYHSVIFFTEFRHPIDNFTHWSLCPDSKDPILMLIEEDT